MNTLKNLRIGAKALATVGLAALVLAMALPAAASTPNRQPTLTAKAARFVIPTSEHEHTWRLTIWACPPQVVNCGHRLLGSDVGTTGTLHVKLVPIPSCRYQVDVQRDDVWYSGFKATVPNCMPPTTTTTLPPTTTTTAAPTTTTTVAPTTSTTRAQVPPTSGPQPSTGVPTHGGTPPASVPPAPLAMTGASTGLMILGATGSTLTALGATILWYTVPGRIVA